MSEHGQDGRSLNIPKYFKIGIIHRNVVLLIKLEIEYLLQGISCYVIC